MNKGKIFSISISVVIASTIIFLYLQNDTSNKNECDALDLKEDKSLSSQKITIERKLRELAEKGDLSKKRMKGPHSFPHVAMPVDGGWLLGYDHGEWGGRLILQLDNGEETILIDENVNDIYPLLGGYVVLTGLNHLGLREGDIYLVTIKDKSYYSEHLHSLKAGSESSWMLSSGDLLINIDTPEVTESFILSSSGELYHAECKAL